MFYCSFMEQLLSIVMKFECIKLKTLQSSLFIKSYELSEDMKHKPLEYNNHKFNFFIFFPFLFLQILFVNLRYYV